MITRPSPELGRLAEALGSPVSTSTPLAVGFGLHGYHLRLKDGRELAVKAGSPPIPDQLLIEAYMLSELGRLSSLPVPAVRYSDASMLAMDWIDAKGGAIRSSHQRHMAELLAELHSTPRPFFGFEQDTVIATLSQPNPQEQLWIPFFREQRLLFLSEYACSRGQLSRRTHERIQRLADRLENYLTEPDHPSLIHGDIWSGNVLAGHDHIEALIDPAIYFAHPEVELAFMTMFGSFGREFFDTYAALAAFEAKGFFETRCDIYLLYPLLVHVLVCSPSYASGIERILDKFST